MVGYSEIIMKQKAFESSIKRELTSKGQTFILKAVEQKNQTAKNVAYTLRKQSPKDVKIVKRTKTDYSAYCVYQSLL